MIGFAGLSHLGVVSSIVSAAKGFPVVAFDPAPALCCEVAEGRLPISEPGLAELLKSNRSRVQFSDDPCSLASCGVVYVSADVPTDDAGRSNLDAITSLISTAATAAPSATIVVLSQVPPGFTRRLPGQSSPSSPRGRFFYQVETLIFGRAVERAMHPERIIVGSGNPEVPLPQEYRDFLASFQCPVLVMGYESAELAKISINLFLAASVSVTNTVAELCEAVGADWSQIVPALKLDARIGKYAYLSPGLGIAGGNLERDLVTALQLAAERGTDARVVRAFLDNSAHRSNWAASAVRRVLGDKPQEKSVAVWGLAYKPNTASTKNSPALKLIKSLEGIQVNAYDPQARISDSYPRVRVAASPLEACHGADVLAVMTPWPEFSKIEIAGIKKAMKGRIVIDPFAMLDSGRLLAEGFSYLRLGAPTGA